MGIRMLTLDVKTFLYTEDRGLQVPIVLDHDYIPHTHKIVGTQFCDTLSHPSLGRFTYRIDHTDIKSKDFSSGNKNTHTSVLSSFLSGKSKMELALTPGADV